MHIQLYYNILKRLYGEREVFQNVAVMCCLAVLVRDRFWGLLACAETKVCLVEYA